MPTQTRPRIYFACIHGMGASPLMKSYLIEYLKETGQIRNYQIGTVALEDAQQLRELTPDTIVFIPKK